MKKRMFVVALIAMLIGTIANSATVQMNWTASPETDVVKYEVYYGVQSGIYSAPIIVNGRTTTSLTFPVPNPAIGCNMFFAIAAVDASNNRSPMSFEVPAFVPDVNAPGAPKDLVIVIIAK